MEELLKQILLTAEMIGAISGIATAIVFFVKPVRERIFISRKQRNGDMCLLRDAMLRIYYNNKDEQKIRQYEYENFLKMYEAYKAYGGNSFIDEIYEKVITWEVIT